MKDSELLESSVTEMFDLIRTISESTPEICRNHEFALNCFNTVVNSTTNFEQLKEKIDDIEDLHKLPIRIMLSYTLIIILHRELKTILDYFSKLEFVDGIDHAELCLKENTYDTIGVSTMIGLIFSCDRTELREFILKAEPEMMQCILEHCEKPSEMFLAKFKPYLEVIIDYYEEVERESKFGVTPIGYNREDQLKTKLAGMLL